MLNIGVKCNIYKYVAKLILFVQKRKYCPHNLTFLNDNHQNLNLINILFVNLSAKQFITFAKFSRLCYL